MKYLKHSQSLSKKSLDYLFCHILDGYKSSHEGIIQLKQQKLITDQELLDLLTKNSERLIRRIIEFKLMERLMCVFFAVLFGYMQLTCEDLEMRRSRSVRTKRRQETQKLIK